MLGEENAELQDVHGGLMRTSSGQHVRELLDNVHMHRYVSSESASCIIYSVTWTCICT